MLSERPGSGSMSETLQWAQAVNGTFDQLGAWLANGSSTTLTPTSITPVQFATDSSTSYTVSGTGTAASLASLDPVNLSGTVSAAGPLTVTAGRLSVSGALSVGDVVIGAGVVDVGRGTVFTQAPALTSSGTVHVGVGGTLVVETGVHLVSAVGLVTDVAAIVDGGGGVTLSGPASDPGEASGSATWASAAGLQIGGSGGPGTMTLNGGDDGLSARVITIGAGGVLALNGSSLAATVPITMAGGTLHLLDYRGTIEMIPAVAAGPVTLAAGSLDTVDEYGTLSGVISGAGTLLVNGVMLANVANTYTGGTVIEGGQLSLPGPGSAGTGPLSFAPSVTGGVQFGSGTGSGTVAVGSAHASVSTGNATLTVLGGGGVATVLGGAGGGAFYAGSASGNHLVAGTGATTLVGAAAGNQLIAGSTGVDLLVGGAGNETLNGAAATRADSLFTGPGADLVQTGMAADTVTTGSGPVTVQAGSGEALIFGSAAALTYYGTAYNTGKAATVVGGSGGNALYGAAGSLTFYASQGGGVAMAARRGVACSTAA